MSTKKNGLQSCTVRYAMGKDAKARRWGKVRVLGVRQQDLASKRTAEGIAELHYSRLFCSKPWSFWPLCRWLWDPARCRPRRHAMLLSSEASVIGVSWLARLVMARD